jgi:hypothetical protein
MTDVSDIQPVDQIPPPPKKPNNRRTIFLILIIAFFACGVCSILSVFITDNDATSTSKEVAEVAENERTEESDNALTEEPAQEPTDDSADEPLMAPTETAQAPTPLPRPTAVPLPTETLPVPTTLAGLRDLTPVELLLQDALDESLGESNRGRGRKLDLFSPGLPDLMGNSIIIGWAADDAASSALILEAMARDTLTVLQGVADSGIEYDAVLIGARYPMMIEQLNMVDEVEVLTLQFDRETLAAIDWNTVTPNQIFELADLFIIHPMFEE